MSVKLRWISFPCFSLKIFIRVIVCHRVFDLAVLLQRDTIIEIFYEKHLGQLVDVITASCPSEGIAQSSGKSMGSGGRIGNQNGTKPEILSNICELLCFCVLHHPYRIK